MRTTTSTTAGVLAALALAAPGSALADTPRSGSDGIAIAVSHVSAHTDRADAALERALRMYSKSNDRAARVAYAKSRREIGHAKRDAAKMRRDARTPHAHLRAAKAQALVAEQQAENVEDLAKALRPASGRDESKIAAAARGDAKGREKAVAILTELLAKVPSQAVPGLTIAIGKISQGSEDEVGALSTALRSSHVSNANKRRAVSVLSTSVEGQLSAAETLAALIADPNMPTQAKQGLQTALDAVSGERGSVAGILSRFSSRMPSFVRSFVERIITQARTNPRGMRENHPTGPPAGTPGGPTAGPGAPVPAGPMAGQRFGPPSA